MLTEDDVATLKRLAAFVPLTLTSEYDANLGKPRWLIWVSAEGRVYSEGDDEYTLFTSIHRLSCEQQGTDLSRESTSDEG